MSEDFALRQAQGIRLVFCMAKYESNGAGNGNRTRDYCLGSSRFTTKPYPHLVANIRKRYDRGENRL